MGSLWPKLLDDLDHNRVSYCLLRHNENWTPSQGTSLGASEARIETPSDELSARRVEIDVLVAQHDALRLEGLLARHGFVRLRRWGYAPHRFFVAYDEASDTWLKLDVVTRIAFGRPLHVCHTLLGEECLAYRRRIGNAFVPAAEEDLAALLLHCLVDKQDLPGERRVQIQQLCAEIGDPERMNRLVREYWPAGVEWPLLRERIEQGDWSRLLDDREEIVRRLHGREPVRIEIRRLRDWILRKMNRIQRLLRPDIPTVALLAPDGAGKSTVARDVAKTFYFPARQIYMGLYQNDDTRSRWTRLPGLGLSSRIARQWGRYLSARYHRAVGRLVLFDRYQYDALLPAEAPVPFLGRVRRWLLAHTCPTRISSGARCPEPSLRTKRRTLSGRPRSSATGLHLFAVNFRRW
jgi:hypothetical protein